jgi:uncharacterized membrane protein YeaQ/YmgE (transglycosylase-associated protein family)
MSPQSLLYILVGIVLLLLGRKLFWLFVGIAGFLFGMEWAPRLLGHETGTTALVLAIAAGIVGAVVAILAQKLAIGFAGFLMGGYVGQEFFRSVSTRDHLDWLAYFIGGILGAVLLLVIFDWALIILSSFAGAMLIVDALDAEQPAATWILVVLFVVGLVVQTGLFRRESSPAEG